MTRVYKLYKDLIEAMEVEGLSIPTTCVKLYKKDDLIPEELHDYKPEGITLTSCQAAKQASLGDAILLTRENIGCVAAAISLGLADANDPEPLSGPRVYTELMRNNSDKENFTAPSPKDFTDGLVYACKASGKEQYSLFGKDDSGRYADAATAKKAIEEMTAIQPANIGAVFFYSPEFNDLDIIPDVVISSVRPVELTRFIQAYQYNTGKRLEVSMGGLRAVNSDLIARPYLIQKINVTTYCLGARLIAKYDGNLMGIGMPFGEFEILVKGMVDSRTGFPFKDYPGADE